jgi:hypothetical protein
MKNEDKEQEKVKYPERKEVIIIGGLKSFRDHELEKQMERLEDALLEANNEFIKLRNLVYLHFE